VGLDPREGGKRNGVGTVLFYLQASHVVSQSRYGQADPPQTSQLAAERIGVSLASLLGRLCLIPWASPRRSRHPKLCRALPPRVPRDRSRVSLMAKRLR
jgi:hypothetical protein